jgi:creatinine amidohydrolase
VAVIPVGAIEAHGPHLPLGTDVVIAEGMARSGAERIASRGFETVLLPAISFTAAPFAAAFPGTVPAAPTTVAALLLDVARALTQQGFAALVVANAHLDPAHLESLAEVMARGTREKLLPVICPDLTRKPWALRLGDEFRSGACHAGRYEGSLVMALRPELVREEIRATLAPNPNSLSSAIREGRRTFEESGGPRAYFGWPAEASAQEGRVTLQTLGDILAEALFTVLSPREAGA